MKVKGYFFNNGLFKLRLQHLSELIKSFQSPLFIGNVNGVFIDKCTINFISNVYITVRSIGFPRECALDYDKDLFMKMRAFKVLFNIVMYLQDLINIIPAFGKIINVIPQLFTLCA